MNQKQVWTWIVLAIIVIGGGWYLMSHGTNNATGPIKIGFIGPLTGEGTSFGIPNKAAVEVAVDEINATGGINGRQVQVTYEDGQCAAAPAVSAAQKLINIDGVKAIIGGLCSTETAAIGPLAMQDKVVLFSSCSSAPALSKLGKYFFRDVPSDISQGKFGADYAYQTLGARKIAVLYETDDYGNGLKDVFTQEFQKLGGTIVDTEGVTQDASDFRTVLSKIKTSNPDLVYIPFHPAGGTIALTQAAQLGITTTFLGADAFTDTAFLKAVSGKGKILFTVMSSEPLPQDLEQKILAKTNGTAVQECTGNAYDAMKILAAAMAKAGTDSDKLSDAIRATDYTGVSGHIKFDQNGDISNAAYAVKQVNKDGTVTQIN